jgi:hypothetical protein
MWRYRNAVAEAEYALLFRPARRAQPIRAELPANTRAMIAAWHKTKKPRKNRG